MLYTKTHIIFRLFSCALLVSLARSKTEKIRSFPEGFRFGAASSAYQVEGAWNEDGKTESMWDYITHTYPNFTRDGSNADVSSDAYHHVERDVEIMRELGLDYYRLSLSWPRLLPTSFPNHVNQAGVDYYNKLINEMLKYNIQPVVTIFHWDLPQMLQEMGGWTNPYIIDWYSDYARVVFQLFGDRVKQWLTVNEPVHICGWQWWFRPFKATAGVAEYICSRNLLLAHAKVWHMYDEEFRPSQGGKIGMTASAGFNFPLNVTDEEAAEITNEFWVGWFIHPIFAQEGNYPPVMIKKVAERSAAQGFPRTRLPALSADEAAYIRGTADFCGLNHYSSSMVVAHLPRNYTPIVPSFFDDLGFFSFQPTEWISTVTTWLKVVPQGFYRLLTRIREKYNNPPVYIFENGFPSNGNLIDDDRISFIRDYMSAMLDAVKEGSDVRAYTYWSMIDSFEWEDGYTTRFGLYNVDMSDPRRPRSPRKSAFVYKHILRTRTLDYGYEPDADATMTVDEPQ